MRDSQEETVQQPRISFFRAVPLGLKVLLSEIYWQLLKGLRTWEIRQMQSRLNREYEKLGRLLEEQTKGVREERDSEIELCRKQIDFLSREVHHLQEQLGNLRNDLLLRRKRAWGLETGSGAD